MNLGELVLGVDIATADKRGEQANKNESDDADPTANGALLRGRRVDVTPALRSIASPKASRRWPLASVWRLEPEGLEGS